MSRSSCVTDSQDGSGWDWVKGGAGVKGEDRRCERGERSVARTPQTLPLWMVGWMDGWRGGGMDGQTNGWIRDGWMNGWMEGRIVD